MITLIITGFAALAGIAVAVGIVDQAQNRARRVIAAERRRNWEARQLALLRWPRDHLAQHDHRPLRHPCDRGPEPAHHRHGEPPRHRPVPLPRRPRQVVIRAAREGRCRHR